MFDICLFDLDDTLISTEDLKTVCEACKNRSDSDCLKQMKVS